jgi:hypothetical protein
MEHMNAPWWRLARSEQTTEAARPTTEDSEQLPPFYD